MKRSHLIWSSLVVAVVLLGAFLLGQPRVQAAPQAVVSFTVSPSSIPADTTEGSCATGTPYAVYVSATGLDSAQTYIVKGYQYRTADTNNRGCFWNWQTASWVVVDNTYTNMPTVSGVTSWSGWMYLKDVTSHAGTSDLKLRVRFRIAATATNADATASPTAFDTTAGGWITGHAYTAGGTLFSNAPVIIRNGANAIIGTYVTEDNAVTEGYTSGDTGYYKVAAPVGTGYTAEVWGSNNAIVGTATTGLNVTANATTANVLINVPDTTGPSVLSTIPQNNASSASLYQPVSALFNEDLNQATVNASTFTLADASGSVAGVVSYSARAATFTPDSSLAVSTRYTATLTTGVQDAAGNPLAAPYVWSFTTGTADSIPPTIDAHFPATEAISIPLNSNVIITFSESLKPSTVISSNFTLVGPSGSIGWSAFAYDASTHRAILTPIALSAQARHTVTVSSGLTDWAGNPLAATSWSFTTSSETPMHAYHGDLHNHTSYSDGSLTAATAYATGRANGFDFMAVTDHSYAVDDGEWADMLTAANNATIPGVFVALRGVEYTQGAEGHINVINTVRHAVRTNTGCAFCDYMPNLEAGVTVDGFYHWLSITGTQGLNGEQTIAQFNHPGWINFNDWTFHPEVSPTMKLEEVGNGSGTSYVFSEDEYIRSLDYGWKIGATNNADTHSPYWGSNTPHRTGVWLPNLTKADLLDALQARRTFATEDVNYDLGLKANGAWMGSEIPNTGSLAFEITGFDPDGEGPTLVQLITFGGTVVTQTTQPTSDFTWTPMVPVMPGVHYFYAKVTQPDGDRIVSSPIWTKASVNVALTDLAIEPTIATIYNPSLITARLSNRTPVTQTITVAFQINGSEIATRTADIPPCVMGPCVDAYPSITWQPTATGPVTVTASMITAPAGDNLDDNTRTATLNATDEKVPLVLIDSGHGNIASSLRDVRTFVNDLTAHGYNVLLNLDQITASDLNTETVKLLIINAFDPALMTLPEQQAIGDFVKAGGSLWVNGIADYAGKISWAGVSSTAINNLIGVVESTTGYTVPIRMNSDEVLDGNNNNGYPWGVIWHNFPSEYTSGIGVNVENTQSWSLCSLTDRAGQALTQSDLGNNGYIIALGDEDAGVGTYGEANRTHNTNSDTAVPAFIYTAGNSVPAAAAYDIPGPAGRIFFYGDANDPYNIFSYTAGDGRQNELFNLQTVMWLLGDPITKSTVAQARAYTTPNVPDKLAQLVWVEGKVTAAFGEFFNVLYVQDETGGITVHAPAGDISATQYLRGAQVRVLGTLDVYQGDTEVEFFEAEQVQIMTPTGTIPAPLPFSTHDAALEANQGWLTQITGTVTARLGESIIIDDGSGPVRAFLDGYNGTWDDIHVLDQVTVKGLISEDGDGPRIRVRNHGMHLLIPDDVTILTAGLNFGGSTAHVAPTAVKGGELITYTLTVSNSGAVSGSFMLTDTLDAHVSLISAPNMTANGSVLTANGSINSQATQTFAITVRANYGYSGTVSNIAQLTGDGSPHEWTALDVQVQAQYRVYLPLVLK
jgi:uncharacterized repeat protein (TIGR01451 family)